MLTIQLCQNLCPPEIYGALHRFRCTVKLDVHTRAVLATLRRLALDDYSGQSGYDLSVFVFCKGAAAFGAH